MISWISRYRQSKADQEDVGPGDGVLKVLLVGYVDGLELRLPFAGEERAVACRLAVPR